MRPRIFNDVLVGTASIFAGVHASDDVDLAGRSWTQ